MRVRLALVGSMDQGDTTALAARATAAISGAGHQVVAMSHDAAAADDTEATIILFAGFVDATVPMAAARGGAGRAVLWALPEARHGGRLRHNGLAAMNLAAHAMTSEGIGFRWLYASPGDRGFVDRLHSALSGPAPFVPRSMLPVEDDLSPTSLMRGDEVRRRLATMVIGVVGEAPSGYSTSAYDADRLNELTGITVHPVELDEWFKAGAEAPPDVVDSASARVRRRFAGVDELDDAAVTAGVRLHVGLAALSRDHHWAGAATRCWPECFTLFGGAACTALALLSDDDVAAACETDTYGVVTALILQTISGEAAFTAELVDLEVATNTGTMWHCGNAPPHMAGPEPTAAVHPGRGLPLAGQFALRPGRVTIARLSQSGGEHQLVIGGGEVLAAPRPYAGTGGVVRFDHPVERVLETIMGRGLEHHYGIVYGDHRATLTAIACRWRIPILSL